MSTEETTPTAEGPATEGPTAGQRATAPDVPAGTSAPPEQAPVVVERGPHAPSLALGLAVLLAAVLVVVSALTDVRVDTGAVVAVALVVLGALLVLGGALSGLRRR